MKGLAWREITYYEDDGGEMRKKTRDEDWIPMILVNRELVDILISNESVALETMQDEMGEKGRKGEEQENPCILRDWLWSCTIVYLCLQ